jgi:hypothetical protein
MSWLNYESVKKMSEKFIEDGKLKVFIQIIIGLNN